MKMTICIVFLFCASFFLFCLFSIRDLNKTMSNLQDRMNKLEFGHKR